MFYLEIGIKLGVFTGLYFFAEFGDISKFLSSVAFVEKRVSLGEDSGFKKGLLVFKTHSSNVSLFEFLNKSSGIVVVSLPGISIK